MFYFFCFRHPWSVDFSRDLARAAARLSHAVAEALAAYSAAAPEVALVALATKWPGQTSKYVRAASPSPAAHPQLSLLRLRRGERARKALGEETTSSQHCPSDARGGSSESDCLSGLRDLPRRKSLLISSLTISVPAWLNSPWLCGVLICIVMV